MAKPSDDRCNDCELLLSWTSAENYSCGHWIRRVDGNWCGRDGHPRHHAVCRIGCTRQTTVYSVDHHRYYRLKVHLSRVKIDAIVSSSGAARATVRCGPRPTEGDLTVDGMRVGWGQAGIKAVPVLAPPHLLATIVLHVLLQLM